MGLRGNVLAWHRPVHKIQVKVVRLQISQRLLHLGSHSSFSFVDRCRPHLGREKQLLPRYAALPQRLAHHRFIVVKLGAVKEAVAGFHRVLSNPHAAGHGILGREGAGAIGPADLTAVAKAENRGFILAMAQPTVTTITTQNIKISTTGTATATGTETNQNRDHNCNHNRTTSTTITTTTARTDHNYILGIPFGNDRVGAGAGAGGNKANLVGAEPR